MHRLVVSTMAGALALVFWGGTAAAESTGEVKTEPKKVEVHAGESLSIIAEAQSLETWRPLWNANPELENPDLIYPGQELVVPQGATEDRPLPAGVVIEPVVQTAHVEPVKPKAVSSRSVANYAAGSGGLMARIRQRESGGNYAINTGNGYYGAYQFDLPTWRGVGGTGLPSAASPAEQDMRAQMLYDRRGCSPWPQTCY